MRTVGKKLEKKSKTRKPNKNEVMKILREKGIEFDESANVEDLLALIPKE